MDPSPTSAQATFLPETALTPLVLLCPAWRHFGEANFVKGGARILHSRADDTIPFADSKDLVRNSGLPSDALIEVGSDHRLADVGSLETMLRACEDGRR
jgi:hypothetical protein